jgi:hypothetical protein
MKSIKTLAALFVVALAVSPAATQKTPDIDVQIVKYDGLKDAVLKNRGKVILIDFWGYF